MANCAYRIFKDGTNYGIAINVTDAVASTWGDFGNYNLYVNGAANITSNLNVGGTISGGSFTPTNPLAVEHGGTGATTATEAWIALGGGASGKHADSYFALAAHEHGAGDITSGTLPIARGGTNATTAANARTQLGITPANIGAKATQTAVSDPAYDGDSLTFINTISQNTQGVITPHKAAVRSASTTQNGIVTIGEQTFAGLKTFTSSIDIQTAYGYLRWKKSIGNNDISALISANNATTTDPARFWFYQYILDSSGNHITNNVYERFSLPAVTTTRTASKDFNILTDKSAVTIGQGGTGATTATEAWTALGGGASGKHADSYFALASHNHAAGDINSGTLSIARGGTGKATATEAWTALGGGASGKHADSYFALANHNHAAGDITSGTLGLARGGTGATTAALARTSLGLGTAAIHAHGDYVNLADAQTIAGNKTFSNYIYAKDDTYIYGSTLYWFETGKNQVCGEILCNYMTTSTSDHRFYFREWSYSTTTTGLRMSNYEQYRLPIPAGNMTSNVTYDIWTTKNYYATSSTALTYTTNSHCDATNLGYLRVDRSGRIAVLTTTTALYLKAYSSSSWIQIGTVPAGYRPVAMTTVRVPLSSGNYMVRVTTDGALQIYKSTNETSNAYFSIPWRIA